MLINYLEILDLYKVMYYVNYLNIIVVRSMALLCGIVIQLVLIGASRSGIKLRDVYYVYLASRTDGYLVHLVVTIVLRNSCI